MSRQSLVDLSHFAKNKAMLDRNATSEVLRTRLAEAFDAWQKQDPSGGRTKAEFARQCAASSGRTCSPQTVGSWFKTGRMDKRWVPVVEAILGRSLGFGGFQNGGGSPSGFTSHAAELAHALDVIVETLQRADEITRLSLEPLFAAMVRKSDESGEIARRIGLLLAQSPSANVSGENPPAPKSAGHDFEMDGDRGTDGTSDSVEDAEKRRPGVRSLS